jgi:carbon-monoxide dehydrogenase medium subunit
MTRTCWNRYHTPDSLEEAMRLLNDYEGQARVVGGGTDLLLEIQQGHRPAEEALVDTSRITGLDAIALDGDHIVIGCAVTHAQIARSGLLSRHGTCLVEGCGVIGGPQVRNVATLAGNVAHALPAGDGSIALLALGGEVEVTDASGSRWIPLRDAFLGPGKSAIDPHHELLTRLRFQATRIFEGSSFSRVMRPQGVALPMISMAARVKLDRNDAVSAARISIGPAGPVPHLAEAAMASLEGEPANEASFRKAAAVALENAALRSSKYRATEEYRADMILNHLPLVLEQAAGRARAATGSTEDAAS